MPRTILMSRSMFNHVIYSEDKVTDMVNQVLSDLGYEVARGSMVLNEEDLYLQGTLESWLSKSTLTIPSGSEVVISSDQHFLKITFLF